MSLQPKSIRMNQNKHRNNNNDNNAALSLGMIVNETSGEIIDVTDVCISTVQVTYRLSYQDANDMIYEGVADTEEEWELGQALRLARILYQKRYNKGSTEHILLDGNLPRGRIQVMEKKKKDKKDSIVKNNNDDNDDVQLKLTIEDDTNNHGISNIIVKEFMILAGEAMGQWFLSSVVKDQQQYCFQYKNPPLSLPFRCQSKPTFYTSPPVQYQQYQYLTQLTLEQQQQQQQQQQVYTNDNDPKQQQQTTDNNNYIGYCQAWYARRFLSPVRILVVGGDDDDEEDNNSNKQNTNVQNHHNSNYNPYLHSGLGVNQYVQWTSPIRRLGDLQVHANIKRYLRRQRISEWMYSIPDEKELLTKLQRCNITSYDLGCPLPYDDDDNDISYVRGTALLSAARRIERESHRYWLYEYIRRQWEAKKKEKQQSHSSDSSSTSPTTANNNNNNENYYISYQAILLGPVPSTNNKNNRNQQQQHYAIYILDLGLEHRIIVPNYNERIKEGDVITVYVQSVNPQQGLLSLSTTPPPPI